MLVTGETLDDLVAGVEHPGIARVGMRRATALRVLDVIAAGRVAEAIATGGKVKRLNGRWDGDLWDATDTALVGGLSCGVRAIYAHVRDREVALRTILAERWEAVAARAEALDARGELTARQVRALARGAERPSGSEA